MESRSGCHVGSSMAPESSRSMRLHDEELRLALWKKGLNLSAASYRFAHSDLRAELNQLRSVKVEKSPIKPLREGESWPEALLAVTEHLKPYADKLAAELDASRRLQDYLLRLIGGGHVLALGYALPRRPEDYPAWIPLDVWPGKIGWPESSVKGNGLEFVAVRVVTNRTAQGLLSSCDQGLLPAVKKTGRPSLKARIIEAYDALKGAGQIDFKSPMGHAFPQLRAWLSERYPDNAGQFANMADETIRKHVSNLFKEDRNSRKQ